MATDTLQTLSPLFGVVLGWALTGLGGLFRSHSERKKAIATALADLLEVRHRVVGIDVVVKEVRERINAPPEAIPIVRNFLDSVIPVDASLHDRYNNAVSVLAGVDPLLAFSMRSKNILPQVISSLRGLGIKSGTDLGQLEHMEGSVITTAVQVLNECVMELAEQHGYVTARNVRSFIAQQPEIPTEIAQLFDQVTAASDGTSSSVHQT